MKISNLLTEKPRGNNLIATIGLLTFGLVMLFSEGGSVWWDRGLTKFQVLILAFIGIFAGFLMMIKFIFNILNWKKRNIVPDRAVTYILFGVIGWLSLIILVFIQKSINFFPGWFLFALYLIYFSILFAKENDFNLLFE